MAIVDTGDYLAEFGENLETYMKDNLADIQFKGRDPDVKHDFPRDRDPAPSIRIIVPRGTRDYQDGVPILRITASLTFTGLDVLDQAEEIESWGVKIATLTCGDRPAVGEDPAQKNYWKTGGYMIRVYYEEIELFLVESASGSIEVSGRVELIGEKKL